MVFYHLMNSRAQGLVQLGHHKICVKEQKMTADQEHRTQSRLSCRIPMEYTLRRSHRPYRAVVYNISDTGLYAETERELRPGQDVRIHISRGIPEEFMGASLRDQSGIIRWTVPMSRGGRHLYGVGIRLSEPLYGRRFEGLPDVQYFCDVCGEQLSHRQVRKVGLVWVCPSCSEWARRLPVAVCKVTSRHLIGNVI